MCVALCAYDMCMCVKCARLYVLTICVRTLLVDVNVFVFVVLFFFGDLLDTRLCRLMSLFSPFDETIVCSCEW